MSLSDKNLIIAAATATAILGLAALKLRRKKVPVAGKVVLITGCDSGFGHGAAIQLNRIGMRVIAGCLLESSVNEFQKIGITAVRMDVSDPRSIEEAMVVVNQVCGSDGLWALINNAGILKASPTDISTLQDWKSTFDINVIGVAAVTKACWALLRKAKGRIVNVASMVGFFALPNMAAYCASKYAVEGLSDAWRRELRQWGVKVIIIEPGIMKTKLYDNLTPQKMAEMWSQIPQSLQELYGREWFDNYYADLQKRAKSGSDPQLIVDAMEAAVTSENPKHRYGVGEAFSTLKFFSRLPSTTADYIIASKTKSNKPRALKNK